MSNHQPPKLPLKLFRFYCSDDRLEELEGDLYEVYNEHIREKGPRFAKLFYWWIVIRSFRSFALKRTKMKDNKANTSLTFLRHNLMIAWRNLLKNKSIAAINVLGLAIGVGSFLAILSIVSFELSFNTQIPEKDKVYRIYSSFTGSFTSLNKGVAVPIGPYVEETFSGLDEVAYFHTFWAQVDVIEPSEKKKEFEGQGGFIIASPSYFKVIDQYQWLAGSPEESLDEPFKVVLTTKQAQKYFGKISWLDMIGRELIYRDSLNLTVSGIVKMPDYNTDFEFTDFISHATIDKSWLKDRFGGSEWGNTNSSSQLWVRLNKNTNKVDVMLQLEDLEKHVAEQTEDTDWVQSYQLQPLSEMHFDPEIGIFDNGRNPAHMPTLTVLSVVALAILLIAIFNFVNLETAQSTSKSKEVGVRKVLGSPRSQLVGRFLTESILISLFAVVLAIPIAHYGFVYFEEFLPEGVALDYGNPFFWMVLALLAFLVGLIAGIYPAWVISSFRPVRALRPGAGSNNPGGSLIRKTLILFQFLFSQLLIVGTLAIAWQISFMLDKDLGFKEDGIIYFYTPYYESYNKSELIKNYLDEVPEVMDYALQSTPPVQSGYSTSTVKYQSEKGEVVTSAHQKTGDTTYLRFYDIKLLAGRNLLPNDSLPELLINETFMRDLGFNDPREAVGATFEYSKKKHKAVGVVEDFHFRSLHHPIEPMLYQYREELRCIALKVKGDQIEKTIDNLTDKWREVYPDNPLTVYFMDETVERFYETERRASKLASAATGVAILISCLGLFGLISFTIVQKSKELGIRKVLGASIMQISTILSKEFIFLIVIAFVVSTPISYYVIDKWMEDFAYQTEISWWIYVVGGLASMLIALISISAKVWKASGSNPIESLRYE
ncbi:ABC-type antimicrobial peptide transport system, permease component [Ekhidna lutea]|uniref:ABC-type antimicrobial peptide transport system, permease component n=2 Tax=Ekhidna lutea TaxID=447679 RepID=A0A239KFB3_EKHLU|nr:ABC-type antimicrobial peptide transport system, permease component [Ekhidna lutea]